jgi:opacity protein-like surface antigen
MTGKIKRLLLCTVLLAPLAAQAQQQSTLPVGRLAFAVTYNAAYAGLASGNQQFWLNGGSAELTGQLYRGLGVVANVTGLRTANTGAGVPLNLVTTTFGPRYTWTHNSTLQRTVSIFGEGMIGEAHGFDSLFPGPSHSDTNSLSLAMQAGGGVDVGLSSHLSIRAVHISWLRTQLPNTTTNVQNDLLVGVGIVFHTRNR